MNISEELRGILLRDIYSAEYDWINNWQKLVNVMNFIKDLKNENNRY